VSAYRVSLLSFLVVDVQCDALFAVNVVGLLVVVASAFTAPDRAVGVLFVAVLPATVAADEVDLLGPSGEVAGDSEVDQGIPDEYLEEGFVRVRNGERDVGGFVFC